MSIENFFRKEVLDLPAYHLDEHPGIKLNQNESPWDIPVSLKAQVIENLLKIPWNRYPLGDMIQLKKRMAKYLGVWPDNLVFANGSNVLIQALIMATSVNNKVMIVDPTFSVYEIEAKLLGNEVHRFSLADDFSIDPDAFLKATKKFKPRIIFIPNPSAPTGNLFDPAALEKIIKQTSCPIVIDEAYYPFSKTTLMDLVRQYDHLILLRTFSKAFALGGVRLGYLIAEPEVAIQIEKCLLPFRVSRLSLATALTLLEQPAYGEEYMALILKERDRMMESMQKMEHIRVFPSNTNFILFKVSQSNEVFKALLQQGIIVRQVSDGRKLKDTLRVTVGSAEENNAFLKACEKIK